MSNISEEAGKVVSEVVEGLKQNPNCLVGVGGR
jgi:hypothetical protein